MRKWFVVLGFVASLGISTMAADTGVWQLDTNHSSAHFTVRHLGITNVQGTFAKLTGTVNFDDQDASKSSVSTTIDVSSVNTGVEARDKDLRSDHYFDVAKFPTMTFQSTKVTKSGEGSLKLTGNLTIHGVTKEVTFDVDGPTAPVKMNGRTHRGATATTKVNRQDFGITMDSPVIGDIITIVMDIDMTQK